jgi:hypothetical protein
VGKKNAAELGEGVVMRISQLNSLPDCAPSKISYNNSKFNKYFESFRLGFDFFLFGAGFSVRSPENLSPLGALIAFSHCQSSLLSQYMYFSNA